MIGHGMPNSYGSLKGRALEKIELYREEHREKEIGLVLWGVGNHGGGPSKKDLQDINTYRRSVAVVEYTISKQAPTVDIHIRIFSQEPNKMLKYRFDTFLCGTPFGETAFGKQPLSENGEESVFHKWCGIKEQDRAFSVLNQGTYGGNFTKNTVWLSLLRMPMYSAHPIEDRQLAPHNRFIDHIDMGEREFFFRLTADLKPQRAAQIYNEAPYALSFFPSGDGNALGSAITVDHPDVILTSVKKSTSGYRLTLHNFSDTESNATVTLPERKKPFSLHFGKYEFKMVETDG